MNDHPGSICAVCGQDVISQYCGGIPLVHPKVFSTVWDSISTVEGDIISTVTGDCAVITVGGYN